MKRIIINKEKLVQLIVIFILIFVAVLCIEHNHLLRCAVLDDADGGKYYCKITFWESLFMGGYKFRPVSCAALWIAHKITAGNGYLYGYLLVFLQALNGTIIYALVREHLKSNYYSIISVVLYIVSRFSYYQITTQLGVMESLSTILAIVFVWQLINYLETKKEKHFYFAVLFYVLVALSHERYTVLMPVILFAWFICDERKENSQKKSNWKKPVLTIGVFILIMLLFKFLVNDIMTGTGNTSVTENFSMNSLLAHMVTSIKYLFGINHEHIWLSMISWDDYSWKARYTIIISIVTILVIILCSIIEICFMDKKVRKLYIGKCGVLFLSTGALIFISSTTIRIELRWLYFPYMTMIFILIFMAQFRNNKWIYRVKNFCLVVYVVAMLGFGTYAREHYTNLYYWQFYQHANALADATYGEYGEEMFKKSWVIVSESDFSAYYLQNLEQFDPYEKHNIKLEIVNSFDELGNVENIKKKQVLWHDDKNYKFVNITNMIK